MINRSWRAGNSRLLTGCRKNDQAILPIRVRAIGLMCTAITPAVFDCWTEALPYRSAPAFTLKPGNLANARRRAEKII